MQYFINPIPAMHTKIQEPNHNKIQNLTENTNQNGNATSGSKIVKKGKKRNLIDMYKNRKGDLANERRDTEFMRKEW